MKVLELFAGGRSFSKVANENGHTTWDTDIEPLEGIDLAIDTLDFEPNMCTFNITTDACCIFCSSILTSDGFCWM